MPLPGRKHIVFAMPGIGRLAYHLSTINWLARSGHAVSVVSCRRGIAQVAEPPPHLLELQAYLDDLLAAWPNLSILYERQDGFAPRAPRVRGSRVQRAGNDAYLLRTLSRYLSRLPEDNFYVRRWIGYLPSHLASWAEQPWKRRLLRTPIAFRLLARREAQAEPDPGLLAWLRESGADVVVASPSNTRNSQETDYLVAAHALGLPTAVPVVSWDNLTTKGLVPVAADLLLAWNREHAREAETIHAIPPTRIAITGAPFFDKWFERRDLIQDRDHFAADLGLDPEPPILLYLGSSKNIAENEGWLVRQLVERAAGYPDLSGLQILVRPHPGNPTMIDEIADLPGVVCLDSEVPIVDRAVAQLLNPLYHAFAVVGINTSGMVDALALDRPCLSIRTDRYTDTHLGADHFRHMVDADAVALCNDMQALLAALRGLLRGDDPHKAQRRHFVERFLRPCGMSTPAGRVAAEAIVALAEGHSPSEVAVAHPGRPNEDARA